MAKIDLRGSTNRFVSSIKVLEPFPWPLNSSEFLGKKEKSRERKLEFEGKISLREILSKKNSSRSYRGLRSVLAHKIQLILK
jgi:hypothetical protein